MLNSVFKHSKFVCNYSNFIRSSEIAGTVLHCSGDSMNCSMAYHVGNMRHFLCWSPEDEVQRPQAASVQRAVLPWLYMLTLQSTQAWSKTNCGIRQNAV